MKLAILVAAAFLISPEHAFGGLLRIDFAGGVYDVEGRALGIPMADPEGALGGSIRVGTRFSGYFILDDATAPYYVWAESASQFELAIYRFAWPAAAMHTEVGSFVSEASYAHPDAPTGGYSMSVGDHEVYTPSYGPSSLRAGGFVAERPTTPGASLVLTSIQFDLRGAAAGLPLHSTSLAAIPWNLQSFPEGLVRWYFNGGDDTTGATVSGVLDGLSAAPVPEPAIATLLGVGAAGLYALGFRRGRS